TRSDATHLAFEAYKSSSSSRTRGISSTATSAPNRSTTRRSSRDGVRLVSKPVQATIALLRSSSTIHLLQMRTAIPVRGSIAVTDVTLGFAVNAGNSIRAQTLFVLHPLVRTRTSPAACEANSADARSHAATDDGLPLSNF